MFPQQMMTPRRYIRVASFDIGKKNFSFCVEDIDLTLLKDVRNISKLKRYNASGCSTEMQELLDQVCMNGEIVLHQNVDLTANCDAKKKLDPQTFINMYDVLDEYKDYWDRCDDIVIEEQMSFGRKTNTMALKLGQHCYSYFVFHYHGTKNITVIPAYHKTQVFGAPKIDHVSKTGRVTKKAMDKAKRKKWSVEKAYEIFELRQDQNGIAQLDDSRKKDDLADTLVQLQAYKYLRYVDKTLS